MPNSVEKHPSRLPSTAKPPPAMHKLMCGDLLFEYGGELKRFRKNRDVVVAGKHYDALFVNHDGWLFRYKILRNGDRQIIDYVLPGQIFGLQAYLFKASLYSVSTITEVTLSSIPLDTIDRVFERTPALAKALFWSAVCESSILAERVVDTARRAAYERISHLLLELFVRLKTTGLADSMTFEMPLTQELIGGALGLTTVHVNRTLRSLREDKLIAIDGRRVTILDFDALSLLSDFDNSYLGEAARALRSGMAANTDGPVQPVSTLASSCSKSANAPEPKTRAGDSTVVPRQRARVARLT